MIYIPTLTSKLRYKITEEYENVLNSFYNSCIKYDVTFIEDYRKINNKRQGNIISG